MLALWVGLRGGRRIEGFPLDLPDPAAQALALLTIVMIVGILVAIALRRQEA